MPKHIPNYDNCNQAIVGSNNCMLERSYFNRVFLPAGQTFIHHLPSFESCLTVASGTCDIEVSPQPAERNKLAKYSKAERTQFSAVGQRKELFAGKPDSVYVPLGAVAQITGTSPHSEIYIAGGRAAQVYAAFRIPPEEVDTVQYGSDETKTHRKIYHILGKNQNGKVDKLLVSELFTVGSGGWSGFPPHKHQQDRYADSQLIETDHEEIYHFRFRPSYGFGAQFAYASEQDFGPVYHIKDASTILLDKSYHPAVAAPGYEMYYFTILVGKSQRPLVQFFEPQHSYQLQMIPGIMDMVNKFK